MSFYFMAAITICSDFGAQKNTLSSFICHEVMGPDAMILVFWMLSFKPTFWLSSFTFIKRLFRSSSLSAIRVVSSAYLRLLIFLLAILIPACASYSPTFLMMYSAYKLNKQDDNIQPWCTPFPIWNQSVISSWNVHVMDAIWINKGNQHFSLFGNDTLKCWGWTVCSLMAELMHTMICSVVVIPSQWKSLMF